MYLQQALATVASSLGSFTVWKKELGKYCLCIHKLKNLYIFLVKLAYRYTIAHAPLCMT